MFPRSSFWTLSIFLSVVWLSACSSVSAPQSSARRVPPMALSQVPDSEVEAQLLLTARSIEHSLNTLIQQQPAAQNPPALNTTLLITPEGGMGAPAVVDWSGPIQGLVEKIAELTHYELKILGQEPAIPILVSISSKNKLVADLLKDAGLQMGSRGDIVLYPKNKVIELRYAAL